MEARDQVRPHAFVCEIPPFLILDAPRSLELLPLSTLPVSCGVLLGTPHLPPHPPLKPISVLCVSLTTKHLYFFFLREREPETKDSGIGEDSF